MGAQRRGRNRGETSGSTEMLLGSAAALGTSEKSSQRRMPVWSNMPSCLKMPLIINGHPIGTATAFREADISLCLALICLGETEVSVRLSSGSPKSGARKAGRPEMTPSLEAKLGMGACLRGCQWERSGV